MTKIKIKGTQENQTIQTARKTAKIKIKENQENTMKTKKRERL